MRWRKSGFQSRLARREANQRLRRAKSAACGSELPDLGGQRRQLVLVEVKHLKCGELPDFGGQRRQLVLVEVKPLKRGEPPDLGGQR